MTWTERLAARINVLARTYPTIRVWSWAVTLLGTLLTAVALFEVVPLPLIAVPLFMLVAAVGSGWLLLAWAAAKRTSLSEQQHAASYLTPLLTPLYTKLAEQNGSMGVAWFHNLGMVDQTILAGQAARALETAEEYSKNRPLVWLAGDGRVLLDLVADRNVDVDDVLLVAAAVKDAYKRSERDKLCDASSELAATYRQSTF